MSPKRARHVRSALRASLQAVRTARGGARGPGRPVGITTHVVSLRHFGHSVKAGGSRGGGVEEEEEQGEEKAAKSVSVR